MISNKDEITDLNGDFQTIALPPGVQHRALADASGCSDATTITIKSNNYSWCVDVDVCVLTLSGNSNTNRS